ncbi:FecR family protein [Dongia mobilis]|uniref:FecR family protein n=1 Tax=Dongia mobilis TaxID=578943 RepID=A0A4R6WRC5_9PROT|nr:FecR domain-containing protein [Dongia mobilis]TDQ81347.1 FecR family protein [Dongia mobilis]
MKTADFCWRRMAPFALFLPLLAVAAGSLPPADALAQGSRQIGQVILPEYRGAVARPEQGQNFHRIDFRDPVFALDTVRTGSKAMTALEFLDLTRIDIGPGAEVRLDDFVYDPGSGEGAGTVNFAVGAFRYVGGTMTTEENVRLNTPTTTMVIRGTELVIFVWPDGSTEVNVISGAVEVSACRSGGGQLLMSGMRGLVRANCEMSRAPVRAMTDDVVAAGLPDAEGDETGGGTEPGVDRDGGRGDGTSRGRGGQGGTEGGTEGGGGNQNGGGGNIKG